MLYFVHSLDIFIQNYFALSRTPVLTEYMLVISTFLDFSYKFILVILCVAYLIYLVRGLSYAWLFVASLFAGGLVGFILKNLFNVSRPLDSVILESSKSFPSNHAVVATIFFGMLMYIFDKHLSRNQRIIFNIFCTASILAVSFSRIYLGVHWLSDVLGGIFLGGAVLLVSISWYNQGSKKITN